MSQRKWILLWVSLCILSISIIGIFIFQLKGTNDRLEIIQGEQLDSYEVIEDIMYYNIERANAIRGLLAYDDRHFLEMYYSMSRQAKTLKQSVVADPNTPSSVLDLLERDAIWETEADRVLDIYEDGDLTKATAVAETMTEQRQTILEDLRSLKQMQYKDIHQELLAAENQISFLIQILFTITFLLIAIIAILSFLLFRIKPQHETIE
ncbi:hypothetical protein PTI97_02415 [Exiguobacterium marinum]|uniref:Four helix bundle sensory module for signal transduction n=1 Tax=Exiguobacterium marinum TaxID=273528 RepID=A0ABY7X339_9BACL|nr:hypothetical protein [Exiguobacterium marinum]WDH76395.1 hypothetical protein PTI97_02415 [Exiguobacterium marinum]